ncbi:MAG: V-type ATPase subunit [Coriobacteriia bacterium]|nr:V-type ATPase subunit [Coriobacteriia bacterium]
MLTSTRDDIRYGFAVGRVRVLQARLLSRSVYERLIDAPDFAEQRRVLSETAFGRYLEHADTSEDVERALDASLGDLYDEFLLGAGLPEAVVRYFRLPYDYRNLRTALKTRVLGMTAPGLSALGTIEPAAFAGSGEGLPDEMASLLTRWDEAEQAPPLADIETAVDHALFAALAGEAKRSRIPFLRELTTLRIDLAVIRVLLRANGKRLAPAAVLDSLIDGGTSALLTLAPVAGRMDAEELAGLIVDTRAVPGLGEADLTSLERYDLAAAALDAARMASARRAPSGPEPVLAYVLGREAEVVALRVALVGRLSGLDREAVRERLRGVM